MSYKVINRFQDTQDNNTLYEVGDEYPKTGHKPTKKRIDSLLKKHPKYGVSFIEEIEETKEDEKVNYESEKPSSEK